MIILLRGVATAHAGSPYPEKPIRMVVPFPPGDPTDIVARPFAQMLGAALKTTVVIDNRGGAGGAIGAEAVARSAPDGYTLIMATVGTHAINVALYEKLPYDPVRDVTPMALVAAAPVAIVVHASRPVYNVAALVALAKATPAGLRFASAGSGTPGHLTGEMFRAAAKLNLLHVPYKGRAPALIDVVAGQVPLMFDPLQSVIAHVQAGRLRAIAVSSALRSPVLPHVSTIAEAGYPAFAVFEASIFSARCFGVYYCRLPNRDALLFATLNG